MMRYAGVAPVGPKPKNTPKRKPFTDAEDYWMKVSFNCVLEKGSWDSGSSLNKCLNLVNQTTLVYMGNSKYDSNGHTRDTICGHIKDKIIKNRGIDPNNTQQKGEILNRINKIGGYRGSYDQLAVDYCERYNEFYTPTKASGIY